jgi:hypothetical protein
MGLFLIFGVNISDMDRGTRVRLEGLNSYNHLNYRGKSSNSITARELSSPGAGKHKTSRYYHQGAIPYCQLSRV